MNTDSTEQQSITFTELDPGQSFADQIASATGPCTLLDLLVVPHGSQDTAVEQWRLHSQYMKTRPGCISAQMHRTPSGDGRVLVNLAVWESPAALLEAVTDPEFAKIAGNYPDGTVCTRQLVRPEAVGGICVA
ncbi:antibiotic biosynthesis monooxygenase family protein [Streptomyces sp. NPDC005548]|uniref:antibiotic biosynthesis monooxygenase family protein n=1 Tax=Streptomyces sp. NPDC005548 TaxID=3364724 RepID=UPI00368BC2A3